MEDVIQIVGLFTMALFGSVIAAKAAHKQKTEGVEFILFATGVTATIYPFLLG